jgi:outer membrane protein assembly factor BamB
LGRLSSLAVVCAALAVAGVARASDAGWLRYGGDAQLTNDPPVSLAPGFTAGSADRMSRLWSVRLDGSIIGSPLFVPGLSIGGHSTDVAYAVTEGGSVYALSARTGAVLWQRRLGTVQTCDAQFGITGSPVIDPATQTLYVIGATGALHALDLATGTERGGWPVQLLAHPDVEYVWGGLTLEHGRVYVPVASYCDEPAADGTFADGRLIAVDAATGGLAAVFDVVPGADNLGGIWGYGGASVDPLDGSLWTATGNSWVFDPGCGCIDEGAGFAESIVHLSPDLAPLASNRPSGLPSPIVEDTDFGSTPLLFQPAGCPPLAAAHAKNGYLYVWDRLSVAGGPIWQVRIGPDDLDDPFIGEPSWSESLQTLFVADARVYGDEGVLRFDAAVAFRLGPGCTFPSAPTWIGFAGAGPKPPPLVVGDLVFVAGGNDSALYELDARDGSTLWAGALDGSGYSPPILADGAVLVGDQAGQLTAFAPDGGCPQLVTPTLGKPSCGD